MAQVLKDGTGSGNTAQIDDHGRLYTLANVIEHLQHHSWYHQDAYMTHFNTEIQTTNETPVTYFKNQDSDKDFEFYYAMVSADAPITVRVYFDPEYTSGGTDVSPINMFRGSGKTLSNVEFKEGGATGNLVLDLSDAKKSVTSYMNANMPSRIDFQGALVFRNNRTGCMTVEAAAGTNVAVTVLTAGHPVGSLL